MTTTESFKRKNLKFLKEIIFPEIEPGIINNAEINDAYLTDIRPGERERLHREDPVVHENITKLRMEFRNILLIEHLWILPNLTKLSLSNNKIEVIENIEMLTALKELDLSFNYIEKIENLDTLVNLEVLSLFNNEITDLENLDALEKLIILSVGNNRITSPKGIERFRFLNDLKVLNLEGNPLGQNPNFNLTLFIAALLPQVKYYKYDKISDEMRQRGEKMFVRELREIASNEEKEIVAREQKAKEAFDAERLSLSFVEHLNEHQLYQSLWDEDEDGRILMQIGQAADDLAEEYDNDMYDVTQEIYKLGLERYEERESEIREFKICLEEGTDRIQELGHTTIDVFDDFKTDMFDKVTVILRDKETRMLHGEEETTPEIVKIKDDFDEMYSVYDETLNDVWQALMSQELHLHETIEETIVNFQRNLQEMVSKFVEQAQGHFGKLRDIAMRFSENITEMASNYITNKLAMQDFNTVPPELQICLEDREALINIVAGMKDTHMQVLDEREDRLIVRSREFIDDLIDGLTEAELERNREKILEINKFLDIMTEAMNNLPEEIHQQIIEEEQNKEKELEEKEDAEMMKEAEAQDS